MRNRFSGVVLSVSIAGGAFAVAMLAAEDADLAMKLAQFRATQTEKARNMQLPL